MTSVSRTRQTSARARRASRRTWRGTDRPTWRNPRFEKSRRRLSALVVGGLAVASAVAGAAASVHPTGTSVVDPIYAAVLAATVTLAASRASRETWLAASAVAVVMSRAWLLFPALAALGVAVASVRGHRARRRSGALVGALVGQVVLRWPPVFFHGFTAAVCTLVVGLLVVSGYRRSPSRIRRAAAWSMGGVAAAFVVLSVPAVVAVVLSRTDLLHGEQAAEAAFQEVEDGTSASATRQLQAAASDFASAGSKVSAWWTTPARAVPIVAQQRQVLAQATTVAQNVSFIAAGEADKVDYHTLSYQQGHINLSQLEAMGSPMRTLQTAVSVAAEQLVAVRSPWLLQPVESRFGRLEADLKRARSTTSLAVSAIRVLPSMLGADGPRRYFIAFMTPSEARGLDGFIGSYGELTAVNGQVSLTRSGSIDDLETAGPPGALPASQRVISGPADYLARYGAFHPAEFPQDDTYSPDLPTVDQVISQLYPQEGGDQLDGVLAVDPYGLASLLKLTGPIDVPGLPQPLDSSNAAQVLLQDQYTLYDNGQANDLARHDFLQDALHVAFDDLVNGSLPGPRALSEELDPAVRQGRISFWSNHPEDQGLIKSLGLDGAFPSPAGGDLLGVTTQDTGNNKIDSYLHQSTQDVVDFDPSTGSVRAQLTVTLRNDAPSSGLPPIVIDDPNVANAAPGTNVDWLSVYTPLQFRQVAIGGRPGAMTSARELGVNVFSQYVYVPPDSTVTVNISLFGTVATRGRYSMALRLQPMANPQQVSVKVEPTSGWEASGRAGSATWVAGAGEIQKHTFSFTGS